MKVLIYRKSAGHVHSTHWSYPWENYCRQNGIEYVIADLLRTDAIGTLKNYDCLLWHFGQYDLAEMLEARSILYAARRMGLQVFPDFPEAWHFDDKVAEMYALQAVNAPIPKSEVFYDRQTFEAWLAAAPALPVVGKLRTGSGSHNVRLLKTRRALRRYGRQMLAEGYDAAPSLLYKASSNIRSSHDWKTFREKARRIPEFLSVLSGAKKFPKEHGYIYLQAFIPNDNYDMKVVVAGDKLSGVIRPVRSHDFRASGGGEVFFDKRYFSEALIRSAFETADALGTRCIGFDYVVDNRNGRPSIVEMSYGFAHTAVLGADGYFDRQGLWHDTPLNAPEEILKNMFESWKSGN